MTDNVYWIWFQLVFGVGSRRSELMMNFFDNPKMIFDGIGTGKRIAQMLLPQEIEAAKTAMEQAKVIEARTLKKKCAIITPDSEAYPDLLKDIFSKPAVLYVKGDLSCLEKRLSIAMVGSRKPSEYGLKAAYKLSFSLAQYGAVIVSGLANGIDAECHRAAVEAGSQTIGILGCGIDIDYPLKSAELKRAISENGAVVTEYPLGYEPRPFNFPVRNRIISGMSHGVVVVEAGISSGSLITVDHALEQGRDVFAVPGDIFDEGHEGANKLIKDGAKLAAGHMDILEEYSHIIEKGKAKSKAPKIFEYENKPVSKKKNAEKPKPKAKPAPEIIRKAVPSEISGNAKTVYGKIEAEPALVESIAAWTGMEIKDILVSLTELEIYGLIQIYPGRKFGLKQ